MPFWGSKVIRSSLGWAQTWPMDNHIFFFFFENRTTISMTSILWLFFIKPRYYLALWVVEIWTNISYSKIKNFINWTNWNLHFILCFYCTTHHSQVHKSITHAHKHTGACTHTHICFFFIYFATTIYVDLSINQLNFG